jgi:F-type H+-transporting ATPase subunit gamma
MKTIKRRITSVETTKKIMKAMNMVAAAKLQKARVRLDAARPFADTAKQMIADFAHCEEAGEHACFRPRKVRHTAYIVITSDRGLCGSHNINLAEKVLSHIKAGRSEKILAVGIKGQEYFHARGKNIWRAYPDVSETVFYEDAELIAGVLRSLYASGEVDEAYVAYTQFESALTHIPRLDRVLPVRHHPNMAPGADGVRYDPDILSFIDQAMPMYLSAFLYAALIESSACEQAARMISMESAANNASDIIHKLTRAYNRRRQAAITQEISEIVSSANMLQ